jgi:GNAT superfamily N-acetyltransferase
MITIRTANIGDLDRVAEIYVRSWQDTYPGIVDQDYLDGMTPEHCKKHLGDYIADPYMELFVAVDASDYPVGILACNLYTEMITCGMIDILHIDKKYKGMGIGTELVKECARYMRAHGRNTLAVDVIVGNDKAIGFYKHTGATSFQHYLDIGDGGIEIPSLIMIWDINDLIGPEKRPAEYVEINRTARRPGVQANN